MKFKKKVKTRWHQQRLRDSFFKEAKIKGYRSRSAIKLIDINKKFRIFKKGHNVLDIGAAPGGWSQVLSEHIYSKKLLNVIVGIDIKRIKPVKNIIFIKKDIFDKNFNDFLKKYFPRGVDLIVSDAAPSTSGNKSQDHINSLKLCQTTFKISLNILNTGGFLILKIFQGKEIELFLNIVKEKFLSVNLYKPKSSQKKSKEIFIIAKFFK